MIMKIAISILTISLFLFSCGSAVDREQAISLTESIHEIAKKNKEPVQKLLDAIVRVSLQLNSDPNCEIDVINMVILMHEAHESNKEAILELQNIKEIDEEVNFRNKYENIRIAEHEVLRVLAEWLEILQETRDVKSIEKINDKLYDKLKIMKNRQLEFEEAEKEFNRKYQL